MRDADGIGFTIPPAKRIGGSALVTLATQRELGPPAFKPSR